MANNKRAFRRGVSGNEVVFLGAGASRAFGYALTSEILPEIVQRAQNRKFRAKQLRGRESCEELLATIEAVLPAWSSARELPPVTNVLSVLDHCLLNGERLVADKDLAPGRELLDVAIADVTNEPIHDSTLDRADLAQWLLRKRATVISTNYDVSVDFPLLDESMDDWDKEYVDVDFGFAWRTVDESEVVQPSNEPCIALYKLHGSLNWLKCHRCGHIYVNFGESLTNWAGSHALGGTCECGEAPMRSILVTPSFVRTVKDANLLSIWLHAGEALRRAKRWTFIGYSLPPEDIAIRSLLLRAYHGRDEPPEVEVVNLCEADVQPYRVMFKKCSAMLGGLETFRRSRRW